MKTNQIIRATLLAGLLAALALPVLAKEDQEEGQTVAWDKVPAAVQNTITTNANGGTVSKVEVEVKKGVTVYEAEVKGKDGKELEIKVAADGALIKAKAESEDNEDNDNDGDKEDKD